MLKVYAYFADKHVENGKTVTNGYTTRQFREDWAKLDKTSQRQLVEGVENGTLNY